MCALSAMLNWPSSACCTPWQVPSASGNLQGATTTLDVTGSSVFYNNVQVGNLTPCAGVGTTGGPACMSADVISTPARCRVGSPSGVVAADSGSYCCNLLLNGESTLLALSCLQPHVLSRFTATPHLPR